MPGVVAVAQAHQEGPREGPPWLRDLLGGSYFSACLHHAAAHKSERNFFCTECAGEALCSLCVQKRHSGAGHTTMQIRRSSYHEAVRISDIQRLVDLSLIQVYVINSAKIVFLNGRPQARPQKGAPYSCETCHRTLLDACRFCSIGCKLAAVAKDQSLNLQPRVNTGSWGGAALIANSQLGEGEGEGEESADSGAGEREREGGEEAGEGEGSYERRKDSQWRKRVLPPLIVDDGDSGGECSQGYEGYGGSQLGMFSCKKKKRTAVKVVDIDAPPLEPSSPTSSVAPPGTPPQLGIGVLEMFRWKAHRRKGVPHRAPLW